MTRPQGPVNRQRARERLRQIRERIGALGYIASGTLLRRTKLCGKPNCTCASDPAFRHGPYYQWSRRKGGRQDNTVIPAVAVDQFRRATTNYKRLRTLLRQWEEESVKLMLTGVDGNDEESRG